MESKRVGPIDNEANERVAISDPSADTRLPTANSISSRSSRRMDVDTEESQGDKRVIPHENDQSQLRPCHGI